MSGVRGHTAHQWPAVDRCCLPQGKFRTGESSQQDQREQLTQAVTETSAATASAGKFWKPRVC